MQCVATSLVKIWRGSCNYVKLKFPFPNGHNNSYSNTHKKQLTFVNFFNKFLFPSQVHQTMGFGNKITQLNSLPRHQMKKRDMNIGRCPVYGQGLGVCTIGQMQVSKWIQVKKHQLSVSAGSVQNKTNRNDFKLKQSKYVPSWLSTNMAWPGLNTGYNVKQSTEMFYPRTLFASFSLHWFNWLLRVTLWWNMTKTPKFVTFLKLRLDLSWFWWKKFSKVLKFSDQKSLEFSDQRSLQVLEFSDQSLKVVEFND